MNFPSTVVWLQVSFLPRVCFKFGFISYVTNSKSLDYNRVMQNADKDDYQMNYLRNLRGFVEDMKEAKYFPTLRQFTYFYLMCELNNELPKCDYCDISCDTVTTYRLPDLSMNVECFGVILQYVTWLLPLLLVRNEHQRASTMMKRTFFYFRFELKDVKRIAFISHIFVSCQYEVQICAEPNFCRDFLYDLWSILSHSIDVKKEETKNEVKVYFSFVSFFMADVHFRLAFKESSKSILENFSTFKLERNNNYVTEFIECLLDYFLHLDNKHQESLNPSFTMPRDLKFRMFAAVGGDRLYATRRECSNTVVQTWTQRLSLITP